MSPSNSTVIACIGAGNIGRSWAIVFARSGHNVRVFDTSEEALSHAGKMFERSVEFLVDAGEVTNGSQVLERVKFTSSMEDAIEAAAHVQECAPEREDIKKSIFESLDRLCPKEVTLASSTSELLPSQFLQVSGYPERCLVAHPVNPPHLIPLVELCPAPSTAPAAMQKVATLLKECGMSPINMKREINGFILNRLQAAILGEAFDLVAEGLCTIDDVDKVMTEGLARRWSFIGPLATGHLNATGGYTEYIDMLGPAWKRLIRSMRSDFEWDRIPFEDIAEELTQRFPLETIADAQFWRDKRLIALAKHLRKEPGFSQDD